ncbi:AMP-binding protein [Flavobacterium sp. W21_SRS_FM6]|uniref:AMP-binding protein n=1 Tax=Flavobacterium sp. W21_SRS_FM6 TaxID=3240268 RepID=UPI003F8E7090
MSHLHLTHWPAGIPKELPPATQTFDDNLRNTSNKYPDKAALIFYGAVTTYAELDAKVTAIAGYLQSTCGVTKGSRIGVYMQNSPQYVAAFYGIIRAGGVVVPINAMHRSEELAYICKDASIRTLFCAQDLVDNLSALLASDTLDHVIAAHYGAELPSSPSVEVPPIVKAPFNENLPKPIINWTDVIRIDQPFTKVELSVTDPLAIPYTSGSTGKGKGCQHTHLSAQHALSSIIYWFSYQGNEVHLGATPMFHIVGLQGIMNVSIATGATNVIMSRWDREAAAYLIEKYQVTTWCTVPTAVIDLLNTPELTADSLASLRCIYGGGSAMPNAIAKRLNTLTGLTFIEVYGMTETMGPVTHNPLHNPKAGSVGIPVMNTEVQLFDSDTKQPVSQGEVGEIIVHGPQVMQSYWQNPNANIEAFITVNNKKYLRTGDLAIMDEQGYIRIVDRLKRMINASGYKVWPAEVEAHLYHHPAIEEVCVIGSKDDYRGENVKAIAVLKPNTQLDIKALSIWAQEHMAAYKIPRILEVVDILPKSAAGKVLWQTLQANENAKHNSLN